MKNLIVIPARLESTRLPNKVLLDLNGKTVLERVYDQCMKVSNCRVFIATDNEKIVNDCERFTKNIILTSKDHESGTDRIAEAVKELDCEVIVNVQGDEPFIDPKLIAEIFGVFTKDSVDACSAMEKIKNKMELLDPNVVKVGVNKQKDALYFSRSMIPFVRDDIDFLMDSDKIFFENNMFFKHVGIYGYRREFLLKYSSLDKTPMEKLEKLEQLRILENGYKIRMIESNYASIGIDSIDDYEQALKMIKNGI